MMRHILFIMALTLSAACFSCQEHDIGQPCPQLLDGSPLGSDLPPNETQVEEIVEQNVTFDNCSSLVCIATLGDTGYCSRKCRNDAGCPAGFECRQVQTIGPFADSQFCAFKRCETDGDCGDAEKYVCRTIDDVHPTLEVKLCRFKEDVQE